jgi:hypothetical protein
VGSEFVGFVELVVVLNIDKWAAQVAQAADIAARAEAGIPVEPVAVAEKKLAQAAESWEMPAQGLGNWDFEKLVEEQVGSAV